MTTTALGFEIDLQRSVASDNQIQRHLPPGARLLSAAMKRSRLPRRWKSSAGGAESTPLIDVDMQEITLRRLGRVGVTEIASSMVSKKRLNMASLCLKVSLVLFALASFLLYGL